MKKLLTVLFALMMVFALTGCGKKEGEPVVDEPVVDEPLVDPAPTAANTYADYLAAGEEDEIEILMSVQAHQGWWEKDGVGVVSVYAQDDDGGYFLYNATCDEATAEALTPGTLIRVKGYVGEWAGEREFVEGGTIEVIAGGYDGKVYDAVDLTDKIGDDDALIAYQNQKVSFKGLTVVDHMYNWDGSGSEGDDIYLTAKTADDKEITLVVESYLHGPGSEVYDGVDALAAGDVIDVEAFLYWYEGAQPHINAIAK